MRFKKGTYRFVFVFPFLGITIKLPRFHLFSTIRTICRNLLHREFKSLYKELFISVSAPFGLKNHLFGGVADNWREYLFSRNTKNAFVQPTYFSFFG